MTNEWQVRRICSLIRSTEVAKAFFSTSNVTGSSARSVLLMPCTPSELRTAIATVRKGFRFAPTVAHSSRTSDVEDDVQPRVDLGLDARRDERGGVQLVDHDRPGEADAGLQVVAPVDRRGDGDAVEVHVAQRVRRRQLRGDRLVPGEAGLRCHADRLQLEL